MLSPQSLGKGLNNLIQQYSFFTKKEIVIYEGEEEFLVKVPIIKTSDR
jgi:hypothetical protein